MTLKDSTAAASTPSTKTGPEHCGWERWTDYTGTTGKADCSPVTRKTRVCRAERSGAFWKMELAGFGSALRRAYPDLILREKRLETTTCPTACRAMSSVRAVITAWMGRCSLAAPMG